MDSQSPKINRSNVPFAAACFFAAASAIAYPYFSNGAQNNSANVAPQSDSSKTLMVKAPRADTAEICRVTEAELLKNAASRLTQFNDITGASYQVHFSERPLAVRVVQQKLPKSYNPLYSVAIHDDSVAYAHEVAQKIEETNCSLSRPELFGEALFDVDRNYRKGTQLHLQQEQAKAEAEAGGVHRPHSSKSPGPDVAI